MDAFGGQNLTIEDDIQQQLLAEGTKTVKFKVRPNGFKTTISGQTGRPLHLAHTISVTAITLLLSGWIITAIIAHIMYRYIQKLQTKLDSALLVPTRFHLDTMPLADLGPSGGPRKAY